MTAGDHRRRPAEGFFRARTRTAQSLLTLPPRSARGGGAHGSRGRGGRSDGIDEREITVRQLLRHTSGLPEYPDTKAVLADPTRYHEPRELLGAALAQKAHLAPGTSWEYDNSNHLLADLIIQEVTKRPLAEEITKRVINRVGLRHTCFPAPGDMTIREAHPKGVPPASR